MSIYCLHMYEINRKSYDLAQLTQYDFNNSNYYTLNYLVKSDYIYESHKKENLILNCTEEKKET